MSNEVKKVTENEPKGALKLQNQLLAELEVAANNMGQSFTNYGKKCVTNAIANLVIYCKNNGCELTDFEPTLVRLALQNVGYTELNIAAIPSECFCDIRNSKDGKKTLAILPQGAGYEKLLRTYGVGVKEVRSPWYVREGDDFTFPSFDGLNIIPPKWSPKSYDKKVIMVVYPIIKTDGSVEYLIATREQVKASVVAQIRQTCLYKNNKEEIYARLEKDAETLTLDELIAKDEWNKILSPAYRSYGARESMIIRKMQNLATKKYPKDYRDAYMAEAVKNMSEDKDDSLIANPQEAIDVDVVEKTEKDINEQPQGDAVPDFDADGVAKEEEGNKKPDSDGDYGF